MTDIYEVEVIMFYSEALFLILICLVWPFYKVNKLEAFSRTCCLQNVTIETEKSVCSENFFTTFRIVL